MSNSSSFNPICYYRFFNGDNKYMTLSSGQSRYSLGAINMTVIAWSSSENWQLYNQSGRVLIRNYDFGAGFQLGISDDSLSKPRIMVESGDLGQQWIFSQLSDGSWQITNELLGDNAYLQLPDGDAVPIMSNNKTGTHWFVEINNTVNVTDAAMLSDVANLESPTSTRTLTPIATTSLAHIVSQNSSTAASAAPSCPSTSNDSSLSKSSIAVLGFASAVILVTIVLLVFFFLRRRRRERTLQHSVNPVYHNAPDAPMPQYSMGKSTVNPSELDGTINLIIGRSEIDGRTR
ncbi:hypothetical protein V8E54_008045 [Elaphomyces granulatus]